MKLRKQIRGYEGLYEVRSDGAIISMPREKRLPNGKLCQSKERVMSPARIGEDVPEEPKVFWYISDFGYVFNHEINNKSVKSTIEEMKSIGNYFLSREEAEKAVEKLKAWKRLKDFGCGFMLDDHFTVKFVGPDARKITSAEEQKSLSDSYKLLFGGE